MMNLKSNVKLKGISAVLVPALFHFDAYFSQIKKDFVLTSVCDSIHKVNSKHYKGEAFDLRTYHLTNQEIQDLLFFVRQKLNFQYDIVLEKDHIHVEWNEEKPI